VCCICVCQAALALTWKILAREPRNAKPHFLACLASAALYGPSEAIAFLEQAFAVDPQNAEIRAALNRVRGAILRQVPTVDADMTWLLPLK